MNIGNKYIPFSEEQKIRAANVDLADFLRSQGEKLIRAGHEWRWVRHDSVTIDGNIWCQHSSVRNGDSSRKLGGNAVSFVRRFYNLSYPEAVTMLLNGGQQAVTRWRDECKQPKAPFVLPEANTNMRRVYAYLMKQRCIDADVITNFTKAKTLYEDAQYHNAVFVGVDENDIPRHAHKRSTLTVGEPFRGNVQSSDPKYSFHHIGTGNRLYVFEAPVDMLSFITMNKKDWQAHSYLALCGVAEHALMHTLETHTNIKRIGLCLDNDRAGLEAAQRITEKLRQAGYSDVSRLLSHSKDWNADLQAQRGVAQSELEPKLMITMET